MEASSISVLGPLFRITEIYLWEGVEDVIGDRSSLSFDQETTLSNSKSCNTVEEETRTNHIDIEYIFVEEAEFAYEMDSLGLPLSFATSKVLKNSTSRSKRKGTKQKFGSHGKEMNNRVPEVMVSNQMVNSTSSRLLHDTPSIPSFLYAVKGQTDTYHDSKEHCVYDCHSEHSTCTTDLGIRNEPGEKPILSEMSDFKYGNLTKSELSPDTTCFEWNAEMLDSLNLHSNSCTEEVFEDACSQIQIHQDVGLLSKHDHGNRLDVPSTSHCYMHPIVDKWDTKSLQKCSVSTESPLFHQLDNHHDNFLFKCGNWMVFWDPFYQCNYFFNLQSQESTWYPPTDLENYAFPCINVSIKETHVVAAEKIVGSKQVCGSINEITDSLVESGDGFHFTDKQPVERSGKIDSVIDFVSHFSTITGNESSNVQLSPTFHPSHVLVKDDENDCEDLYKEERQQCILGSYNHLMSTVNEDGDAFCLPETYMSSSCVAVSYDNVALNKKQRVRRCQLQNVHELNQCLSDKLLKYWCQRYSLFSKFDDGIKMDDESWFSVTPELLAKHHALRCGDGTIIDCFAGVGGNAIQFAMRSNHVIAIDVDPWKIDYAQHNAVIYGVSERIDFIKGDFFKIFPTLKGDVVFLSPPWGGPDYAKVRLYDISLLKPCEGCHLFKVASMIAAKVVMFLPRNVNLDQLADLSLSMDPPWSLEVEKNYLNGRLKSITAYYDKTPA